MSTKSTAESVQSPEGRRQSASSHVQEVPAQQQLMQMLMGLPVVHMISAGAQLGIFAQLATSSKTATDVAIEVGTPQDTTYRLMRGLSAVGVLHEGLDSKFQLTAMGKCLLPDTPGSFDAMAQMMGSQWMSGAYQETVHSIRTGESAFSKVHGQEMFDFFATRPETGALFGRAMSTFSGVEVELVVNAYDFSKARHIVDVGGGHGLLLNSVLEAAPEAKGTLFDAPDVVAHAGDVLNPVVARRCTCVGGDFFETVPEGGDVYLLKHILHDWGNDKATRILENISQAMTPGARLVIVEQGIAPPGIPNPGKVLDVCMLVLLEGGMERGADAHAKLLANAGLRFEREISTPGSISLFEATKL